MENRDRTASLLREPMIIFLIVASFFFVVDALFAEADTPPSLVLTTDLAETIILTESAKRERPLSPEEEKEVLETYLEHELFFLDAVANNTHRDFTFYNQIIRKHQALLTADMPMPTHDEIESYYLENQKEFSSIEVWNVDFIYGETVALAATNDAIAENLESYAQNVETHFGVSSAQLSYLFSPEIAAAISDAELNKWIGPYSTLKGPVLLKTTQAFPSQLRPFEAVKDYALNGAIKQSRETILKDYLSELRANYRLEAQ